MIYLLFGWTFCFLERLIGVIFQGFLNVLICYVSSFHFFRKCLYYFFGHIFCAICCVCHTTHTDFLDLDHLSLPCFSCSLYLVKLLVHVLYMHLIISSLFVYLWFDVYNLFIDLQMVFGLSVSLTLEFLLLFHLVVYLSFVLLYY